MEELLVKLLLMFIFAMLLEVVALLVIVLTMFQVVLGLRVRVQCRQIQIPIQIPRVGADRRNEMFFV